MARMRTVVSAPPHWVAEEGSDGRRVLRIPGKGDWGQSDLTLVLYPLKPLPDPVSAFIPPFVSRELPAGTELRTVSQVAGRTTLGQPMVLVEAEVVDKHGKLVEARLAALYQFLEFGGGALARCSDRTRLEIEKGELIAVLSSGRADFSGHIAALEQLFVGFPEDVSWGS
jgi:hypothetical protein